MANGQSGKGSSKNSAKDSRNHHSGRKWYFAKKKDGGVHTLYAHNKSPIQAQDGTDPGSVVQIRSTDVAGKIKVKYSSGKSRLLDLTFLTPTDDLNRRSLLEISDISRFGEMLSELLDVEFCESCSGKRKGAVAGENDLEKAKRPRSETHFSATGPVSTQVNQTSSARASSVPASDTTDVSISVSAALNKDNLWALHGNF